MVDSKHCRVWRECAPCRPGHCSDSLFGEEERELCCATGKGGLAETQVEACRERYPGYDMTV